jgi:hypothetical protein
MPKPAAKPNVATESLKQDRVSRLRFPITRAYGRFGGFLEWAIRVAAHPHEHGPERPVLLAVDQDSARVRLRGQVAEECREHLQPSSLSELRTGEPEAHGGEVVVIAVISIGIIIIIAVIIAALAIITSS